MTARPIGDLSGRVALVTGAGSGIGRAIAIEFAGRGASVAVTDVRRDAANSTVAAIGSGRNHAEELDVTRSDSVAAAVGAVRERFGRIDVLVNNAGINVLSNDVLATTEDEWDRIQAVNLRGVFLMLRAVLPAMIAQGGGSVVNIASVNGLIGLGSAAYSAAKAGVLSLTRNTALQYGPQGIRVNAICPGTIVTPAWNTNLAAVPDAFDRLEPWYAVGRVGTVDDVAPLAAYLASDDAGFVTGSVFTVDGGLSAGVGVLARGEHVQ